MKLSTKTRYGIRAILDLAMNAGAGPVQTKLIARRQDISAKYLEQLMALLKMTGFVRSIRGAKGGYVLAKPPDQVRLVDLFKALEGPVVTVECLEDENYCHRTADCIARQIWSQVENAVDAVLGSITLQDLMEKAKQPKRFSSDCNI